MKKILLIIIALSFTALTACKEEGALEKAGKKVDDALQDAAEKVEKVDK